MPKEFYTERDIEDMVKRGILSLEINDNVVLTDLAYERANRLGMKLVRDKPDNPPGAPVRPYLSQPQPPARVAPAPVPAVRGAVQAGPPLGAQGVLPSDRMAPTPLADHAELHQRIKNAVIARLGGQVDSNLLDVIIQRVIRNAGIK
jgi:hypothetical protein